MQKDSKIEAKHKLNGEIKTFTLVATPLKRQKEGAAPKFYPFFEENDELYAKLQDIFGEEYLIDLAIEALKREFQSLYFVRSPQGQIKKLDADGKPETQLAADGKTSYPKLIDDETPKMDRFLSFIEDENLSGREITVEYCMRKAVNIQSGVDKKFANADAMTKMKASMEWMVKAQSLAAAKIAENAK